MILCEWSILRPKLPTKKFETPMTNIKKVLLLSESRQLIMESDEIDTLFMNQSFIDFPGESNVKICR